MSHLDICGFSTDLVILDTQTAKAGNVLSTQIGDLHFAPTFGVDRNYFLSPDFQVENDSFKAYLVERLTWYRVNVAAVLEVVEGLFTRFNFKVSKPSNGGGLIQ